MSICIHFREGQQTVDTAYRAAKSLLKENHRITAIVTVHNTQAVGTSTALQELNRKVPDDCSVMGVLVSIETSPQHSTGAALDRYDEPSNANCSQRRLQISGNYQ